MSTRSRGRHAAAAIAATASLLSLLVALPAAAEHPDYSTTNCPAPESLVTGTTWHRHPLAPGVMLSEGRRSDRHGYVDLHVLGVDVTSKHVALKPLAHRLAQRTPLSKLAAGHTSLVAATNTGYFDFETGTPLGPLVDRTQPWVTSATDATVVGVGKTGLLQAGELALTGTVAAGGTSHPLAGLNVVSPGMGLTAYSSRWGAAPIRLPRGAVTRYVVRGRLTTAAGRFNNAPGAAGYLLVARGATTAWLSHLSRRTPVSISTKVTSTAAQPFSLAYAVGSRLVHQGVEGSSFTCRRRYPQPARTAIGFADNGRRLLLVVAADDPGTRMHGLDSAQMARVMHDLGATEAYLFDGSGSTELLARMPKDRTRLSLRNFPADGIERPMPVGFGIFRR